MKMVPREAKGILILVILSVFAAITISCKSKAPNPGSTSQNTPPGEVQNPQQTGIDDLVAPIALYPDQLLAQVLTVSINPQEVLDLGNWLLQNQNLQGDAMSNAAKQAGFSPSAQYLAMFPQVVDNMCQQMDWTTQLGQAFKSDQKAVMDAVQRKRAQAEKMGNLDSSSQMKVENKTADNGQPYVAIQPADPKVVYVPQYNPVTIYNSPAPAAPAQTTTTTTKEESGVSKGEAAAIGLLSFGIGMAIGSAINNDNYYPYPAWGYHNVYVAGRPYYPAAYRPPVYAGYRPAYGYRPPGNYRWNQYNRNVNATVNNNYYNRFNARNTNVANNRQTYRTQNRSGNGSVQNPNWKGQTTYQGARQARTGQTPGASMANAIPRNQQYGNRSTQLASNRASTGMPDTSSSRTATNRTNRSEATTASRQTQPNFNRGGDRGYGTTSLSTRSTDPGSFSNRAASSSRLQNASAGGAFGGDGGSGRQARTASNRGRASMGTRGSGRGRR